MLSKVPPTPVLERRIGDLVKRRYRLSALIGAGGQGAVYRATDLFEGDEVAVKVLHEESERDPVARERLLREAEALMVTRGTAAVQVLDQGFSSDGRLCLVTELLEGCDLEDSLLRIEEQGRSFPASDLVWLFEPLVTTLERAHAAHIVHRDLKPANVFLDERDGRIRVRLMDFGFAKFQRLKRLTLDGFVAGSPSYIAPETWLERTPAPSVDVYALGALMYRTLAGQPPFSGEGLMAVVRAATSAPRPSLHALRPDLPRDVDAWVQQALAISPEERFQTPRAALYALCTALGLEHGAPAQRSAGHT
ncbi:serine/threonine-protein kinase [Sandaracinus amylolyticus]|uniref:Serine/threonine protein kinase n=1 Tax=Sandaracinus amylolyticus TaxID=927083 RepID=A0A0F6SFZ2_9BACT|nr:serine/threonine-protein kinase [Sandaracinus amylolyticus]AKF07789.1 serine/threonine protein kinase [Sandaracinus amylolyticus]